MGGHSEVGEMHLGKEWRGRLPPGAQEQLDFAIEGWRTSGVVVGVQLDPGPGCAVAERLAGVIFALDGPPLLPVDGCERKPCCGCSFSAVIEDEDGSNAKPVRRLW